MREVFFESTAAEDVLVDKNGDPLDLDSGGGASSSYFYLPSNQVRGDHPSGSHEHTLPWEAGRAGRYAPEGNAPLSTMGWGNSGSTGVGGYPMGTAFGIETAGVWAFNFALYAIWSAESGSPPEFLRFCIDLDGDDIVSGLAHNYDGEVLRAEITAIRAIANDIYVNPFIQLVGDVEWTFLGSAATSWGRNNYEGCSFTATFLG